MSARILVIDDSQTIHKVIKIAFARYAIEVHVAQSLAEALSSAIGLKPRLLIVDAGLPLVKEPADFTRLKEAAGHAPVLFLLGSYQQGNEAALRAAGFSDFIRKPFDAQDMLRQALQMMGIPMQSAGATAPSPPVPPPAAAVMPPQADVSKGPGIVLPPDDPLPIVPESEARRRGLPPPPGGSIPGPAAMGSPPATSLVDETRKGLKAFLENRIDERLRTTAEISPGPSAASRSDAPMDVRDSVYFEGGSTAASGLGEDALAFEQRMIEETRARVLQQLNRFGERELAALKTSLEIFLKSEAPVIVRKTIDEYCSKNFKDLARELITAELRRLAEERSRLLVDS